jgi:hypothetical protein
MSNTYTVWGMNGATRLAMNQHHMAGVLRMRGGLGDPESFIPPSLVREVEQESMPAENATMMPVRDVQQALKNHGYSIGVDGEWGPNSRSAMTAFKRAEAERAEAAVPAQPADTRQRRQDAAYSYWINARATADTGATQISIPFGDFRTRLFGARRPAPPPPPPPPPPTPEPPAPPEVMKAAPTDWTTWAIAGTGVVVAGVAIWAIFRKRRKG